MACSLPCVATRVGGNSEALVDGYSGFLVDNEDESAMADKLLLLLRDRALARQMGEAGRQTAEEKFSAQAMMQSLVSLYDRVLEEHP